MRFADYISKWRETHALDMTCYNFFLVLCWDFSLSLYLFTKKKKKKKRRATVIITATYNSYVCVKTFMCIISFILTTLCVG